MKVNTSNFDLRNMAINKANELAVRLGLQRQADFWAQTGSASDASLDFQALAAFSVKSQFVDDICVYVMGRNWVDDNMYMYIYDETIEFSNRKQVIPLGKKQDISDVTHAVVNGQLVVSGPEIPTLWGYTGSGMIIAKKQDSANTAVETIDVPRGICVSWTDRCVIASGEALFISDPYAPRTYTAQGIVPMPGFVYGLHVGANGDLIAVTSDGVYALNPQASAQGTAVVGSIQKLSSYRASDYKCSVVGPDGIYGLTERGIARIDIDQIEDIKLSDKTYVRSLTQMIDFPDYRVGQIHRLQKGIAVTVTDIDSDADGDFTSGMCVIDLSSGLKSWWTMRGIWRMVDTITSREGDDFFVMQQEDRGGSSRSRSSVFNFETIDGDWQGTVGGQDVGRLNAYVSGVIASDLETSPVVRYVYTSSSAGGSTMSCAVRGQKFKRNGSLQEYPVSANGVVIGTDLWQKNSNVAPGGQGSFTSTTPRYKTCELQRIRFDFAKKTNDISLEVGVQGAGSRIRILNMTVAGYGVNAA